MTTVDSTLHLGEVFLETADGSRISLGQLKAPFSISIEPAKPAPIQIGSTVRISDNPKCTEDGEATGWVDPDFAGRAGTVYSGPNEDGDWRVQTGDKSYNRQTISPKHLTVVSA